MNRNGRNMMKGEKRANAHPLPDALVRAAFEREEASIGLPEGPIKPEYRLMGSAVRTHARSRSDRFAGQNRAFAFALALFAVIVLVPSVLSAYGSGFSEITAAGIQADRRSDHSELAAWSINFANEAKGLDRQGSAGRDSKRFIDLRIF